MDTSAGTHGRKDLCYSAWHRTRSTSRFVGMERAQALALIDLDAVLYVEFDPTSSEPLCLIEVGLDIGQDRKPASATMALARRAKVPAYVLLYKRAQHRNPADPREFDIERFRIKRLFPKPEPDWRILTPEQWAVGLVTIREWSARRLDLEAANDPVYDLPFPPVAMPARQ